MPASNKCLANVIDKKMPSASYHIPALLGEYEAFVVRGDKRRGEPNSLPLEAQTLLTL